MAEHFTFTNGSRTMPVTLGDDGVLRDDASGQAVCGRCGRPVERTPYDSWCHALADDYLGGCWWGRPERVPDPMFGSSSYHLRLTPREVDQVEASLDAPATVVPELADAIRRAHTDIKTED